LLVVYQDTILNPQRFEPGQTRTLNYNAHGVTLSLRKPSTAQVSAHTANPTKESVNLLMSAHGRSMILLQQERDTRGKGIGLLPPDMQKDIPR
jgi:hypothetical protein